ncbi:uncharacterized protein [Triticum aestivum]|uniref:uncharacterized protein n=1 Tax=Triticum aestivum TaxID=4565 RepID=UPI001D031B51|nr:uncharacterized protein LOC123120470 [Triticum aestivum]XP_044396417.1 uncharacterized protein LOC123120470 [Triticum aestivum]XP_044396422.1 uncharacterized protein LOC123120470 [Triticum aestivum]XP_044396428.1 uncharacterized protein LOC123120470 [Triticum aestivum]XP_044396437.1 uncharacterized protein LOC123120470 [Triticum aestivum]XP_044396444.1 uncharacterized protein LOC123120470 [Triticum aestivum]XP_044396452.1 uncharacterized protein LOC123120470 [Triticum aestivum]
MKLGSLLTIFFLTYTRNAVGQKKQIEMLIVKLRMVDVDLASGRWKAKISKSHGRVLYLSLRDEKASLITMRRLKCSTSIYLGPEFGVHGQTQGTHGHEAMAATNTISTLGCGDDDDDNIGIDTGLRRRRRRHQHHQHGLVEAPTPTT